MVIMEDSEAIPIRLNSRKGGYSERQLNQGFVQTCKQESDRETIWRNTAKQSHILAWIKI